MDIARRTVVPVLAAISFSHLLNDTIQSLLPAIYPMLKASFHLSFAQIGLMTLTLQLTASLLQPLVGLYTDRRPHAVLARRRHGLLARRPAAAVAWRDASRSLLLAAGLVGVGSSVFHPESSRVARMASGGRHGLAQSVFQVGGNIGSALGPLLAAFLVLPRGQPSVAWCSLVALLAMVVLCQVGGWYQRASSGVDDPDGRVGCAPASIGRPGLSRRRIVVVDRRARRADLLEVLLPGEPEQLLHVLSDQQVRRVGADGAARPVRLPRRGRRRHDPRRADRRPLRPQAA